MLFWNHNIASFFSFYRRHYGILRFKHVKEKLLKQKLGRIIMTTQIYSSLKQLLNGYANIKIEKQWISCALSYMETFLVD